MGEDGPTIERAVKFLEPRKNTDRKSERVDEESVEANRRVTEATLRHLKSQGHRVERPKKRSECPSYRPCPFVSCRHHLYLDVTKSGSIKFNFGDMDVTELQSTCALDAVEEHGEMTLKDTGNQMGLTRERIRQIQVQAVKKLQELDEDAFRPEPEHHNPNTLDL